MTLYDLQEGYISIKPAQEWRGRRRAAEGGSSINA